jgi:outer membrane protein assembly factor BamB
MKLVEAFAVLPTFKEKFSSTMTHFSLTRLCFCSVLLAGAVAANDWPTWRGPLQSGVSLEHYKGGAGKVDEAPVWTHETRSRGCPVVFDGRVFSFGYKGEKEELIELLTCLDEKTGKRLWEVEIKDFISDTVYNRYAIGSATVDPETRRVYVITAYGVFGCWDLDGKEIFRHSMMEDFGRLTFPNSKVGCVVIEGDLVIVRGITANWGADGPAADRFYGFDKKTGELVWSCTPGTIPPTDSSFSTPYFETRAGQRVFYAATGCGNIVCINARNGKPLWRFKACKVGINASPVVHNGDKIICIHGDENVDTTERGRMVAVKLPESFGAEQAMIDPEVMGGFEAWKANEVWRNDLGAASSSPVLVGDHVYQITDGGAVSSVNAITGKEEWTAKVSNGNTHSSVVYADGFLYAPLMEGKLFVLKADSGEVVQSLQLKGNCIGAAMVVNGHVLVHTTESLYRFKIQHSGMTVDSAPVVEMPKAGAPVALQVIPSEFVLFPGQKRAFRVRSVDAKGFPVAEVKNAKWESFIPPTAKVKATMNAAFNDAGEVVALADAKPSAGAFKATADGLSGTTRGRLLMKPPFTQDFNGFELSETQPDEGVKFAYPPLAWNGARFKFDVREVDGEKVFAKTFDRLIFQRATVFIGTADMKDYTLQADVMTDGNRRVKSDVGLINQRYAVVLKGNANQLEISSNFERFTRFAPFKVEAKKWYTLKSAVKSKGDGTGVVLAKVWERGQPEPDAWTLEAPTDIVHQSGSPGLFGFTPQNQQRVYIDNLSVTPNP